MRRFALIALIIVGIAGCYSAKPSNKAKVSTKLYNYDKVTLRGYVVDNARSPVPGAKVCVVAFNPLKLSDKAAVVASTLSDSDGNFLFKNLQKAPSDSVYYLIAKTHGGSLGFRHCKGDWIYSTKWTLANPIPYIKYGITVWPSTTVSGRVINEQGSPIKGLKIIPSIIRNRSTYTPLPVDIFQGLIKLNGSKTDTDGGFSLSGIPEDFDIHFSVPQGYEIKKRDRQNPGRSYLFTVGKSTDGNSAEPSDAQFQFLTYHPNRFVDPVPGYHHNSPVSTRSSFIKGCVVDNRTEEPLKGVKLTVSTIGGKYYVYTDAQGCYRIRNNSFTEINIRSFKHYLPYRFDPKTDRDLSDIRCIRLKSSSRVADEQGKPVAGAVVQIGGGAQCYWAVTNSKGTFESAWPSYCYSFWNGVANGGKVFAKAQSCDGKLGIRDWISRERARDGFVLVLKPLHTVKIHVIDIYKKPIRNAYVRLYEQSYWDPDNYLGQSKTDAKGIAKLTGLFSTKNAPTEYLKARYYICVIKSGYCGTERNDRCRPGWRLLPDASSKNKKNSIDMVLERATRIQKGRVIDKFGKAISDASVFWDNSCKIQTDTKGEFVIKGLPEKSKVELLASKYDLFGKAESTKELDYITITIKKCEKCK